MTAAATTTTTITGYHAAAVVVVAMTVLVETLVKPEGNWALMVFAKNLVPQPLATQVMETARNWA